MKFRSFFKPSSIIKSGLIAIVVMGLLNTESFGQNETLVKDNPFLMGQWSGSGAFLDTNIRDKVGDVSIIVDIFQDGQVSVNFDDYDMKDIRLVETKYGFEIRGGIEPFSKSGVEFKKDKLIILLVFPKTDRETVTRSDANFHLKSNYFFDFTMRVGGVILNKL